MTSVSGHPAEHQVTRGVRLGVDVGSVRVGLAASDPDGLVATPVETLHRDQSVIPTSKRGTIGDQPLPQDMQAICREALDRDAAVVYVGLPRHLSGAEGQASAAARAYAQTLADALETIPVRLVDERMTTVTAHRVLHAAGRSSRRHRSVVDQVAAVEILQGALDVERSRGIRAGEEVSILRTSGE